MDFGRFLLCVTPFLLTQNQHFVSTDTCPEVAYSVGTNFMFGIPTKRYANANQIFVHITSMSSNPAHVRITAPFINYDGLFTVSNTTIVSINDTLVQFEEGQQFKGIEVFSDWNISVSVLAFFGSSDTDGFLVLPTAALSTRYIAASYHPYSNVNNSILVVCAESNTDVSIKYKTTESSFTFKNVTLQKFQTFQVLAYNDLSGAVIISNKPVAVLSGSFWSHIPVAMGTENFIVEQMIPTRYWVTKFIVPPIFPHNYYIVRIFTDEDNTEIHCYNHTHHFAVYLDQGSMHEVLFGSDPTVIVANKPISVIQYLVDNENMDGRNPFMTTVQGMSQFVNSYKFITENANNPNSTIALTVLKHNLESLQLNGRNISLWNPKTVTVAKPLDNYITVFINISYNSFYELHYSNGELFGATIYGLLGIYTAYGYPLQLSLSTSECEETTTMKIESTTHEQIVTTTLADHIKSQGNGTWCMDCDHLPLLELCDQVVKCHTDEVCFVQAYTKGQHENVFRSGCISKSKCHIIDERVSCQTCCEHDFCNTAGCGDSGLPELQHRGPMCFDCLHQEGSDTCRTVQMCRSDQVCKIDKYQWGDEYRYETGCSDTTVCKSRRDVQDLHLQSRSVLTCTQCCHTDFCNTNCSNTRHPEIIG